MLFRHYLALTEARDLPGRQLWIACSKDKAADLMAHGPDRDVAFADTPEGAERSFKAEFDDEAPVILEFKLKSDLPPMAVRHAADGIKIHDPSTVKFLRVWSGVVDDRFKDEVEAKDGELDEVAIGGLRRCTAVTCNALLKRFAKPLITLGDVPETDLGVLNILTTHGLAYKPITTATGRSVQQFANVNHQNSYYLVTPGHAMALVDGELFDAENRGPDGRKIVAAYQVSVR